MQTAMIFDVIRNSFVDGPGIRTSIFFKGCNLHCIWCHNPESQSFAKEMFFYKNKCKGCGKCKEKCPNRFEKCDYCGKCAIYCPHDARKICGREMTSDAVLSEILKDKAFYENTGGGVTFSGGECMLQIDFLQEILSKCKAEGIHTAVDTAGEVPWESFEKILAYTDLFLYDIKCMEPEKHEKYVGVRNTRILENLARLLQNNVKIWVRVPIIPGFNDTIDEMRKIKAFYAENGEPIKTELLPYHQMGENKYAALGRETELFTVPTKEKIAELYRVLLNTCEA